MGINIELTIYDREELFENLSEGMNQEEKLRLIKIMNTCGHSFEDKFIILNNEYGDEWSPYYNMMQLIDSSFPHLFDTKRSSGSIIIKTKHHGNKTIQGISHVDVHEAADELGIELTKE